MALVSDYDQRLKTGFLIDPVEPSVMGCFFKRAYDLMSFWLIFRKFKFSELF